MKEKLTITILLIIFFVVNYSFLDSILIETFKDYEMGFVERVIDGDTIVVNGSSIRLLGINSPEKENHSILNQKNFLKMSC